VPFYGSGSCGSCCLCPCGWSALAIVGAVACSHFKEGQAWGAVQGGVQVSTGGANMVWELLPEPL